MYQLGAFEDEGEDDDAGVIQDVPPQAVQPTVAPAAPARPEEHQPPPVIPYIKSDDAAITRSASMIRGLWFGVCFFAQIDMIKEGKLKLQNVSKNEMQCSRHELLHDMFPLLVRHPHEPAFLCP